MFASFLSALLVGILPAAASPVVQPQLPPPIAIEIAPPTRKVDIASQLSASGILVIDLTSGQQVYAAEQNVPRPIASLTLLMTALIIVENHDLTEWITIPAGVASIEGNKAYLQEGAQYQIGDILSALLISSGNDAARALAIYHSGSEAAFVEEMNAKALELSLEQTSYSNASGLDSGAQWSSPHDLARLGTIALGHPAIYSRMSKRGTKIFSSKGDELFLTHTHALLHSDTDVLAGKTGTTNAAGQCLVTLAEEGGRKYLIILQQSLQRYADLRIILDALKETVV